MSLATHLRVCPLAGYDMDSLLDHRTEVREREEQLSYWRRVVQGRLDLLDARLDPARPVDETLAHVLGTQGQSSQRIAHVSVRHVPPMLELATADRAWDLASSSADVCLLQHARHRLALAERWLSSQRAAVIRELDAATAELTARLSDDPRDYLLSVERRSIASAG